MHVTYVVYFRQAYATSQTSPLYLQTFFEFPHVFLSLGFHCRMAFLIKMDGLGLQNSLHIVCDVFYICCVHTPAGQIYMEEV